MLRLLVQYYQSLNSEIGPLDEGSGALIRTRPSVSLVNGKLLIIRAKRYLVSPRQFGPSLLSWLMVLISNINLHAKCDLMKGRRTPATASWFVRVRVFVFQEGFQRQTGCCCCRGGEMNCEGWISFHRRWRGGGGGVVLCYIPCTIDYFIPACGERELASHSQPEEGGDDPALLRTPLKWSFQLDWQALHLPLSSINQEGSSDRIERKFVIQMDGWAGGRVLQSAE